MDNIETRLIAQPEKRGAEPISSSNDTFLIMRETSHMFIINQAVVSIGRRLDNLVVLDDPRVSRTHAEIRKMESHYVVFDLNSTGGTFINGNKIDQSVIYSGDVLSFAGVEMIFKQNVPSNNRPDLAGTAPF